MPSYEDIINKLKKAWNAPDMMDVPNANKKIPFSSPMMNYATYGGIPRNRITEFHGAESGGKSSTAIDICANAKKLFAAEFEEEVARMRELVSKGKKEYAGPLEDLIDRGPKKIHYADLEHSFDFRWARKMHVNKGDIKVMQPPDVPGEEIVQMIQDIITTGEVGLVIVDSIPSLVTKAELEKKYGERTVSALAGLMTIFMRKITPLLDRYDCTVLLINQCRDNMDNPYIINTPGGKAIKYYSSLRVLFRLGSPVDLFGNELPSNTENPAGYIVNAKIVKQKSAPHDRKCGSYFLMAQSGIRPDFDYAKLAIDKYGIIKKNAGWYTLCEPSTGEIMCKEDGSPLKLNGLAKVYDFLGTNEEYYNSLRTYIENDINGQEVDEDDLVDIDEPVDVDTEGAE